MIGCTELKPLHARYRDEIEAAVRRVLDRGWYILGPELEQFEQAFARYHGEGYHAMGVANGTDAIELALRAAGIGPGDEIITVAHTAVATVCAVERAGATPIIVDIDPHSYTIDPAAIAAAITPRTRAIIPVHIYGQPADMPAILGIARKHHLLVIEDCAQAHGARLDGQLVGTFGDLAAFSFYPTKNLGALGDAGAVLTRDQVTAERVRRLRNYGQTTRYHHAERGMNSRLDEMQAAILGIFLKHLDASNDERRRLAGRYCSQLRSVTLPTVRPTDERTRHVYHLFVVRDQLGDRDRFRERLQSQGVGTLVHYPVPIHLQPAYASLGYAVGSLPVTELAARTVTSLPLFVGLTDEQVDHVCSAVETAHREAA